MSFKDYSELDDKPVDHNPWFFILMTFGLVVILSLRLFQLQVFHHDRYLNQSEDYRIKRVITEAPRGFVYDRNGEMLATNRMSYAVTIDPFERDSFAATVPRLASLVPEVETFLGGHHESLLDTIQVLTRRSRNPAVLLQDVDFETISVIEEHCLELPGVGYIMGQRRFYPYGEIACHILGYMGKLTRGEAERLSDRGYDKNQWIGKYGIERYYEDTLKGENGAKFLEKNYLNRFLDTITDYQPVPAVPGEDITLTIDIRLQQVAEEAFGDTIRGAFVAIDPRTGEILTLSSFPTFNPNDFASVMTGQDYAALVNNPEKPLYNRAIQGTYPPGSPFKVITALAGLENGYPPETRFKPCYGVYHYGRDYHCWNENGHGSLDMVNALAQSCNVYFYQLGRKLGLEAWSDICGKLGFGRATGIDLRGEVNGYLPSPEFYAKHNIVYSPGMILNLSIGQGENDVTPLQLAHFCGIVASEGLITHPHLLKGTALHPQQVQGISKESFKVVKEGMYGVIHNERGTARYGKVPGHEIAGKTGTAQNPHGADHKLFIAFAPYENPTIAIACVAENMGEYSPSYAVLISKKFLEAYFTFYPDPAGNDYALQ